MLVAYSLELFHPKYQSITKTYLDFKISTLTLCDPIFGKTKRDSVRPDTMPALQFQGTSRIHSSGPKGCDSNPQELPQVVPVPSVPAIFFLS